MYCVTQHCGTLKLFVLNGGIKIQAKLREPAFINLVNEGAAVLFTPVIRRSMHLFEQHFYFFIECFIAGGAAEPAFASEFGKFHPARRALTILRRFLRKNRYFVFLGSDMDTASLRARCAQMKRLASFLNDLSQMDVPWKQSTLVAHLHDVYASSENSILLEKRLKKSCGSFICSVLNLLYRQEVWLFPLVYCVAHGEETILSYPRGLARMDVFFRSLFNIHTYTITMVNYKRVAKIIFIIVQLILVFIINLQTPAAAAEKKQARRHTANELFSAFQERVFQIRVIDNSSGKKSAIGSGFSISGDGLFSTNYHVVADVVIEPKRYRLEYVAYDGPIGSLRILDIDVVHDLAIVSSDSVHSSYFLLGQSSFEKGSRIFSIGNPLDLGMTIIEGTYSGFIEGSLYEKIHFSGSLNPGMSGGPALDASGNVIGVNVSTAGQEISFLVPAKYLQALLDTVCRRRHDTVNFTERIEHELYENQERYMGRLLGSEWKQDTIGRCLVPREMGSIFKCWGETEHDTDVYYTVSNVNCANGDDIYLSPELITGTIEFNYRWYETARLGSERFYRVLERHFSDASVPNYGAKNDLDEPESNTRFVSISGADWKTTICSWRYKKYPRLYDVVLKMALVNFPSQSMLVELKLLGVSKDKTLSFCKKFMGSLRCRH